MLIALAGLATHAGCGNLDIGGEGTFDLVRDTTPEIQQLPCDACGGDCILEKLSYDQRYHVTEPIDYADMPPAGGPHHPCWADFGTHAEAVPDERWVHNLEHGAVVALYRCDEACESPPADLQEWAATIGPWTVVTPYDPMTSPYAVLAWQYRLQTSCFDEEAFRAFYEAYVDQAPESTLAGEPESCM